MIRYTPHNEIDFEKWDQCIDRSVNGLFYANSWYLNMCTPGWDALIKDDYRSVMPLPHRKKLGIQYVYQPYFIQQLGIFSTYSNSAEIADRFINAIPAKFKFIDYNLNTFNRPIKTERVEHFQKITHHLDLIEPYEAIYKRYSVNTRRNVSKAVDQGVFIADSGSPDEIIQAFRQNRGKTLQSFGEVDYNLLKHLIYSGLHRGVAKILTAYTAQNNFCGGAVFFQSHNKCVMLFTASTSLSRENGAMFLIIDTFIRNMSDHNLVLDFEGSSDQQLARFYKGFGSKECVFLQIKINRLPFGLKQLSELYLGWQKNKRKTTC